MDLESCSPGAIADSTMTSFSNSLASNGRMRATTRTLMVMAAAALVESRRRHGRRVGGGEEEEERGERIWTMLPSARVCVCSVDLCVCECVTVGGRHVAL